MATFVPSTLRWSVEELKPDARLTICGANKPLLVARIDREGIYQCNDAAFIQRLAHGECLVSFLRQDR
jgi:hypothetical protein